MKREQMIEHLVGEKSPGGFWELVKWTEATQLHTENQFLVYFFLKTCIDSLSKDNKIN